MSQLSDLFEGRVRSAVQQCRAIGYHPNDFAAMLENSDAVSLAKRLVTSGDIQSGLKRLVSLGHPDLSVESIMLEPDFAALFDSQILAAAKWRLDQAKSG